MTNSKLLKVMDYLINEQEDKARDLLHQIFIEKARSIHEEMLSDEEHEMGGDAGEDLGRDIEAHKDEIESEEHYGDGTMEDVDLDDAVEDLSDEMEDADDADDEDVEVDVDVEDEDDMDMGDEDDMDMGDEEMGDEDHEEDHEEEAEEERFQDLEQAIEELKAEFESLKDELHAEHGEAHEEEHEEEVEESWMDDTDDLDEEYDDLDEAVELDTVSVDAKKAAEVGTGKFARPDVSKTSPTPKTAQSPVPGAKPVETGKGPKADGYHLQAAPKSADMHITNRRKKASDDMSHVSKEGSTKAMLNKDRTEGFGTPNVQSPIGSTGTTPKK